ncbi:MAG: hypothetical protein HDS08_00330 [Bacteroides sp.]|nr:hypothetical protein [Bacteroides sp.]
MSVRFASLRNLVRVWEVFRDLLHADGERLATLERLLVVTEDGRDAEDGWALSVVDGEYRLLGGFDGYGVWHAEVGVITPALSVEDLDVQGSAYIRRTLRAGGISCTGNVSVAGISCTGNVSVAGTVSVTGAATFTNKLTVSGVGEFKSSLTVSGMAKVRDLTVEREASVGNLEVDNVAVESYLTVGSGVVIVGDDVRVDGVSFRGLAERVAALEGG